MKIHVKIIPENVTDVIDVERGSSMYEVLKKFNMKPDNIIILRDNTPVPVDDRVCEGDHLAIIKVSSGG